MLVCFFQYMIKQNNDLRVNMYVEYIDEDSSIIRKLDLAFKGSPNFSLFCEIDCLVIIKKIYISSTICTQELL